MIERLLESIRNAPVIKRGEYNYFVHPIADGIPEIDPVLLEEIVAAIIKTADCNCDRIVSIEAMGIPICIALSLALRKPVTIIRKRPYGFKGEFKCQVKTGYSENTFYINGIEPSTRVLLIDDVLSTGNTLAGIIAALESSNVVFSDIVVCISKKNDSELRQSLDKRVKSLVKIAVNEKGIEVLSHV